MQGTTIELRQHSWVTSDILELSWQRVVVEILTESRLNICAQNPHIMNVGLEYR